MGYTNVGIPLFYYKNTNQVALKTNQKKNEKEKRKKSLANNKLNDQKIKASKKRKDNEKKIGNHQQVDEWPRMNNFFKWIRIR